VIAYQTVCDAMPMHEVGSPDSDVASSTGTESLKGSDATESAFTNSSLEAVAAAVDGTANANSDRNAAREKSIRDMVRSLVVDRLT
jgi:hypothetical protein